MEQNDAYYKRLKAIFEKGQQKSLKISKQKSQLVEEVSAMVKSVTDKLKDSQLGPSINECLRFVKSDTFLSYETFHSNVNAFLGNKHSSLNREETDFLWILHKTEIHTFQHHLLGQLYNVIEKQEFLTASLVRTLSKLEGKVSPSFDESHHFLQPFLETLASCIGVQKNSLETGKLHIFFSSVQEEKRIEATLREQVQKQGGTLQSIFSMQMSRRKFLIGAVTIGALALTYSLCSHLFNSLDQLTGSRLQIKGINYDIGTRYTPTFITREKLSQQSIKAELHQIKNQLHCNAVRIYGERINYLRYATEVALSYGLQVWFSPRFINASPNVTKRKILQFAAVAQNLFEQNQNVVFIIGNEFTLDMQGLSKGNSYQERAGNIVSTSLKSWIPLIGKSINDPLNKFLRELVVEVRKIFKGKITYAAGSWEDIDWSIFDIVSVNKYRYFANTLFYEGQVRSLKELRKPVVITEFGCASYKGAEKLGGASYNIVEWNQNTYSRIKGSHERDETVQANYVLDLLKIFDKIGVAGSFVFTYVEPQYVHHPDNPSLDLDMASLGIMKVYPNANNQPSERMEPKKAFFAISQFYKD